MNDRIFKTTSICIKISFLQLIIHKTRKRQKGKGFHGGNHCLNMLNSRI